MSKPKSIISLNFFSKDDPLFASLVGAYLRALSTDFEAHVITFDPPNAERYEGVARHYSIVRKDGSFLLLKRLVAFIKTLQLVQSIRSKTGAKTVLAHAANSAMMAAPICKILGLKLVVFSMEPHTQYMVEMGVWSSTGIKAVVGGRLERLILKQAKVLFVNTDMAAKHYKSKSKAHIVKLPMAINPSQFGFSMEARQRIRKQLGLEQNEVFVYGGKFGGLYYQAKDFFAFFSALFAEEPQMHLLVISPENSSDLAHAASQSGLSPKQLTVLPKMPSNLFSEYLCAVDMGISGIPPSPAQGFRSPVKSAFYWLHGLPLLTCEGVGGDDLIIERRSVSIAIGEAHKINPTGVVCKDWAHYLGNPEGLKELKVRIAQVLSFSKQDAVMHCRAVGMEERSFVRVLEAFKKWL